MLLFGSFHVYNRKARCCCLEAFTSTIVRPKVVCLEAVTSTIVRPDVAACLCLMCQINTQFLVECNLACHRIQSPDSLGSVIRVFTSVLASDF